MEGLHCKGFVAWLVVTIKLGQSLLFALGAYLLVVS